MMQAQKQAAIQADFERYLQDYPQLKHALKGALSTVVKIRPTDPLEFLAERLREENIQIKVAQQEEQLASIRIQVSCATLILSRSRQYVIACRVDAMIEVRVRAYVCTVRALNTMANDWMWVYVIMRRHSGSEQRNL